MRSPLLSQTYPYGHLYQVKSPHVVTSIKQSPVLKGQLFLLMSKKISYELNLF